MGFSPGDFTILEGISYHWEIKDNYVVLWNSDESVCMLRLTCEQARECATQLNTALSTEGIEAW